MHFLMSSFIHIVCMEDQVVSSAMHLVHAMYLSRLYLIISLSVHTPPYNITAVLHILLNCS